MSVTVPSWEDHSMLADQLVELQVTLQDLSDRLSTVEAASSTDTRLTALEERLAALSVPLPETITEGSSGHLGHSQVVHTYLNQLADVTPPDPPPVGNHTTLIDCGGPGDDAWLPDTGGAVVRKIGTPIAEHGMPWQWERYGPRIEYQFDAAGPGTVHVLTAEAWPPNVLNGGRKFIIAVGERQVTAHPVQDLGAHVPVVYSLSFTAGTVRVLLEPTTDSIDRSACLYGLRITSGTLIGDVRRVT